MHTFESYDRIHIVSGLPNDITALNAWEKHHIDVLDIMMSVFPRMQSVDTLHTN